MMVLMPLPANGLQGAAILIGFAIAYLYPKMGHIVAWIRRLCRISDYKKWQAALRRSGLKHDQG